MTTVKTSELTGAALDWAVLVAEHKKHEAGNPVHVAHFQRLRSGHPLHQQAHFSTNWSQGGPIIERERIELGSFADKWQATMHLEAESIYERGPTPLIAAMRCYVASKLGDTIEIPEELL